MQSYFVWNGVDCRSMGVTTRRAAPLIRPEERVTHIQIPGLSGDLTEVEGKHIYNSYIQTVDLSVDGSDKVRSFFRWMRGDGFITFSSDPEKKQPARVIGAVTLEKVSRNLDKWAGTVQFYCQPLKERIYSISETLTAAGNVYNGGDVASHPVILVTPITGETTVEIIVNDKTLTLSQVDGVRLIDCEAQEITDQNRTALYTVNSGGSFPVLQMGSNAVGGSGWSKLEIFKQERFL